jgi:DNA-binding protein YbaB
MSKNITINDENVREDTLQLADGLIDAQEEAIKKLATEEKSITEI